MAARYELTDAQWVAVAAQLSPQRTGRPRRDEPQRYARRNVVERFFGSLKEHRRVATRYDTHDAHFLGMALLACIRRILQHHFSDTA